MRLFNLFTVATSLAALLSSCKSHVTPEQSNIETANKGSFTIAWNKANRKAELENLLLFPVVRNERQHDEHNNFGSDSLISEAEQQGYITLFENLDKEIETDIIDWLKKDFTNCTEKLEVSAPAELRFENSRYTKEIKYSLVKSDVEWCIHSSNLDKIISIIEDPKFQSDSTDLILSIEKTDSADRSSIITTDSAFMIYATKFEVAPNPVAFQDPGIYGNIDTLKNGRFQKTSGQRVFINRRLILVRKISDGLIATKQVTYVRSQHIPRVGRGIAENKLKAAVKNARKNLESLLHTN